MAYVDAPEYNQEYGLESKNWLDNLFSITSSVSLKFIDYDEKHERHIADIFVDANLSNVSVKDCSVSWLMAATGNAWAYYNFLTKDVEKAYLDAQYFARKVHRIGIWTNNLHPTPPWVFRAQEKGENIGLFLEPNLAQIAILKAILAAGNLVDEKIERELVEANLSIQYNRNYYPMRYWNQVCLDKMQYEAIMCNPYNWDIHTGYNGVEGTESEIAFFQIAKKAFQGDEEDTYVYEAYKRGLYMAVGKTSIPGSPEKRLTKEWVDAHILRVEQWAIKNNL